MSTQDSLRERIRQAVRQALEEQQTTAPGTPPAYAAPWTGVEYPAHPSRQQFDILEAASSPTGDLVEFLQNKLCTIEKNRPCDQCGMCKSLGF